MTNKNENEFETLMRLRKDARDRAALESLTLTAEKMVSVGKLVQFLPRAAYYTDKMMSLLMDSAIRNNDQYAIQKVNAIAREMMKEGGLNVKSE